MTTQFLPVTIALRDQALLPSDGASTSPTSDVVIAGTRLRGFLAARCRGHDATYLERLIISGRLGSATAFPITATGLTGYPTPRTAVIASIDGEVDVVVDERLTLPGNASFTRLAALTSHRNGEWTPITVRTQTTQRSTRVRAGGSRDGLGPVTFTTLAPQQVFRAHLRVTGDDREQTQIAQMVTELLVGDHCAIGAGRDNAYGGDAEIRVGTLQAFSDDRGLGLTQTRRVDVVLRTPALTVDPLSGHYVPDSVGAAVQAVLDTERVAGRVAAVSVGAVAVGGSTIGYGRLRPQPYAAAPGSVISVDLDETLSVDQRRALLSHRLGDRTVDGFGEFGIEVSDPGNAGYLAEVEHPDAVPEQGHHILPTGAPAHPVDDTSSTRAVEQLRLLQDRLYLDATARWQRFAIAYLLESMTGYEDVPGSTWGRLRSAARTRSSLRQLIDSLLSHPDFPASKALARTRMGGSLVTLVVKLLTSDGDDTSVDLRRLSPPILGRLRTELSMVTLTSATDTDARVDTWIREQDREILMPLLRGVFEGAQHRSRQ